MNFPWQELAMLLLIGVSLCYVARHFGLIGRRKGAADCGGCDTCPARQGPSELVTLDAPSVPQPKAETAPAGR